jgi:NADH-quinone oxidoreductase subunit J
MAEIFFDSEVILFWIIAGLTGGSAIMTLLTQNIVRSATWLLFTLGGTAGLFFLLGADFVGATQLLVYVGGTLVLVVFGVMLTAQGPFITMKASAAEWAISLIVGVLLYATLGIAVMNLGQPRNVPIVDEYTLKKEIEGQPGKKVPARLIEVEPYSKDPVALSPYTDTIGRGLLGHGVGPAHRDGDRIVRTAYLLPFEIVSIHLLVVLIGAAYLARAKRRRGTTTP